MKMPTINKQPQATPADSEQIAAARANLAQLRADLADARTAAATVEARHRTLLATLQPDPATAARDAEFGIGPLAKSAHEVQNARKTVAALEAEIAAVEYMLRADEEATARAHREQLVAELWPKAVRAMMPAVRGLIAALEQQAHIVAQLEEAGALGLIDLEPLILSEALPDDPAPRLRQWLDAAKRAGYDGR